MVDQESRITRAARLADEFAERRNRGEQPTIEEYLHEYPELSTQIASMFPAVLLLDDVCQTAECDQPEPDEAPELLGECRVIRELGRGGMGVVYEAWQESMQRRVALKVLPRHVTNDSRTLQRFQLEAKSAGRLNHPNIVPVYEVAEHDGLWFYVMQFIPGLGLDEVVRQLRESPGDSVFYTRRSAGRVTTRLGDADSTHADDCRGVLPGPSRSDQTETHRDTYFRSVAQIGVQVATALSCAHTAGIIHRDIKPSNLLLDADANVWVTDFGLVKTDGDSLTDSGDFVGTLRYMAPERFHGTSDIRGDVYGLGITVYELLTLQPAFQGHDRVALIHQVANVEPVRPRILDSRIPRDLETIVLKAISRDPNNRYQTAAELSADLTAFLEDRPIRARRSGRLELMQRWARRNRLLAATIVLAVVSMLSGTALSTVLWLRANRQAAEARASQGQAEATLAMANQAVERFFRLTSSDSLLPTDLRKQLAQECLDYDERFVKLSNASPESRSQLAESHRRIGLMRWEYLGTNLDEAIEAFQHEIAVLDLMIQDSPNDRLLQVRRAGAIINIGAVEQSRRRYDRATQKYEQAIAGLELLHADLPQAAEYMANAIGNTGLIRRHQGRWQDSVQLHHREISLRRSVCASQSNSVEARRSLATACLHLGNVLLDVGRHADARQMFLNSLAAEPGPAGTTEAPSGLVGRRLEAAAAYSKLSIACIRLGQYRDALDASSKAVQVVGDIREQRPFNKLVHSRWGALYAFAQHCHAQALLEAGRGREAEAAARLACGASQSYYANSGLRSVQRASYLVRHAEMKTKGVSPALARRELQEAIDLCRAQEPELPDTRHELAKALAALARIEGHTGGNFSPSALARVTEAIALHHQLSQDFPDHVQYRVELARHHFAKALICLKDQPQWAASLDMALEILQRIREQHPAYLEIQRDIARIHHHIAFKTEPSDAALWRTAITAWNDAYPQEPLGNAQFAALRGFAGYQIARSSSVASPAELVRCLTPAVEDLLTAAQGSGSTNLRLAIIMLAEAHHDLRDHSAALACCDTLVQWHEKNPTGSGSQVVGSAKAVLGLARKAAEDMTVPETERTTVVTRYHDRVIRLLLLAKVRGYFYRKSGRAELERFADLDHRMEYRRLSAELP